MRVTSVMALSKVHFKARYLFSMLACKFWVPVVAWIWPVNVKRYDWRSVHLSLQAFQGGHHKACCWWQKQYRRNHLHCCLPQSTRWCTHVFCCPERRKWWSWCAQTFTKNNCLAWPSSGKRIMLESVLDVGKYTNQVDLCHFEWRYGVVHTLRVLCGPSVCCCL